LSWSYPCNKQLSHVTWPLRNLASDWLLLNWRASGGKILLGVVSCMLLCTVNSIYLSVFYLFCVVFGMYNLVTIVWTVIFVEGRWYLQVGMVCCCQLIERKHWRFKAEGLLLPSTQERQSRRDIIGETFCFIFIPNRPNSGSRRTRRQKQDYEH